LDSEEKLYRIKFGSFLERSDAGKIYTEIQWYCTTGTVIVLVSL